jgi:hypothetical protein
MRVAIMCGVGPIDFVGGRNQEADQHPDCVEPSELISSGSSLTGDVIVRRGVRRFRRGAHGDYVRDNTLLLAALTECRRVHPSVAAPATTIIAT